MVVVPEPESLEEARFMSGLKEGPLKAVDFFCADDCAGAAWAGSGAEKLGVFAGLMEVG